MRKKIDEGESNKIIEALKKIEKENLKVSLENVSKITGIDRFRLGECKWVKNEIKNLKNSRNAKSAKQKESKILEFNEKKRLTEKLTESLEDRARIQLEKYNLEEEIKRKDFLLGKCKEEINYLENELKTYKNSDSKILRFSK